MPLGRGSGSAPRAGGIPPTPTLRRRNARRRTSTAGGGAADAAGFVIDDPGSGLGAADAATFGDAIDDMPPAATVEATRGFGEIPGDPDGRYVPGVGYAPGWGPDSVVDAEGRFVSIAGAPGVVLSPDSGFMTHAQWLGAHLSDAEQSMLWAGEHGEDAG